MKLTFLLTALVVMNVSASSYSQTVTFTGKNVSLEKVFTAIKKQTGYVFFYNFKLLAQAKPVTLDVSSARLSEVLKICFNTQSLDYSIEDKTIVITQRISSTAENLNIQTKAVPPKIIKGRVMDNQGKPLPGATVKIKNTSKVVQTNLQGEFELKDTEDKVVLVVSFIGYKEQEVTAKSADAITIILEDAQGLLDQVVVVAYGTAKVKDVTGSIAHLGEMEIKNAPMGATVQSLLQGKASGVNVAIQSASPTSPISVVIRGASSLSGDNQPLWVIDGVPDYSASTSGNIANSLYSLNLNDVQSIDILKDASATALYGSRAANGVVIVTTKKGIAGQKPTIELSTRLGYQARDFNGFRYINAAEFIDYTNKSNKESVLLNGSFNVTSRQFLDEKAFMRLNTSEFDSSNLKALAGAYYDGNTNWMKAMTQNPLTRQYDLSLRGGAESVSYYVSLFNNDVQGIVKSGKSQTYGGRVSLEAKLRKDIKFGINLNGSSRETDNKDQMLGVIQKIRADMPEYAADGSFFSISDYIENPHITLLNIANGSGQNFTGTGFLEYLVIPGLIFKTAYSTNYSNAQDLTYERRGSSYNYNGTRLWNTAKMSTNVWENTLTLAKTFGKHDILGLAGYSTERNHMLKYNMSASNFPDDDVLNNFDAAASKGVMGENDGSSALISQFARAQYKYNNRYIVSGTIRRDGSSRFGPDQRWGIFPSAAVAWLITEESFMKNAAITKYISYLKLRGSIGKAGSQNLGNYDWITGVGSSRYNDKPALSLNSIGNINLQWEQTQMKDIGLDYGLWNERIRGTVGFYKKNTDQLIYNLPLPPSSSFASINSNVASMSNKGFEFDITVDVVKRNQTTLSLDFNASKNTNRVMKINGVVKELNFPSSGTPFMKALEGGETGQWYGYQSAGRIFLTQEEIIALQGQTSTGAKQYYNNMENPGDIMYVDQNKDGIINAADRTFLGNSDPKLYGGFGATFQFKNLMINSTFTYAYGHKRLWYMPILNYSNNNIIGGNSYTVKGADATMPRIGASGPFSDFWLYDASYIRLNAINISYRLPASIFKDKIIQSIEFTFQASNLFTLTSYPGFDPQGNWDNTKVGTGMGVDYSTYPSAKNFNLGIKFTFK